MASSPSEPQYSGYVAVTPTFPIRRMASESKRRFRAGFRESGSEDVGSSLRINTFKQATRWM